MNFIIVSCFLIDLTPLCLLLDFILTLGSRRGACNSFCKQAGGTKALMLQTFPLHLGDSLESISLPQVLASSPPQAATPTCFMADLNGACKRVPLSTLQSLQTQVIILKMETLKFPAPVPFSIILGGEQRLNSSPSAQTPVYSYSYNLPVSQDSFITVDEDPQGGIQSALRLGTWFSG